MCANDALKLFNDEIKKYFKSQNDIKENELKKLIYTFICLCPSQKGFKNAKKFKNYGINKSSDFKKLKNNIKTRININSKDYIYCDSKNQKLENKIDTILELLKSKKKKPVIFFSNGEYGEMDSLFIRIRNSFAHGNFIKTNQYYILWNENGKEKPKLGCFIMLKKCQLFMIYSCLESFND